VEFGGVLRVSLWSVEIGEHPMRETKVSERKMRIAKQRMEHSRIF
jgi:hypothetical protein